MHHALLINPNTSQAVTESLAARLGATRPADLALHALTAPFGAPYIADEASYAVGAHATLAAFLTHLQAHGSPAAVLVGCFGDPGVAALRSLTDAPCIGLAEASAREAQARWSRFAVVTAGPAWAPMLHRFFRGLDDPPAIASIDALPHAVADLLAEPEAGCRVLAEAVQRAARGVDGVILGGAGLAPLSERVRTRAGVPLLDSVEAGAAWLSSQLEKSQAPSPRTHAQRVEGWWGRDSAGRAPKV